MIPGCSRDCGRCSDVGWVVGWSHGLVRLELESTELKAVRGTEADVSDASRLDKDETEVRGVLRTESS